MIIYHYNFLYAEKRPAVPFSRQNLVGSLIAYRLGLILFPRISTTGMLFGVFILVSLFCLFVFKF